MKNKNFPFNFLIFCLFFSVLAFGMRATWSRFVVETGLCLAMGLFLVEAIRGRRMVYRVPGLVPLGLFFLWMVVQVIPLPMEWVAWLSPEAARLYREADFITGSLERATLSVNPNLTLVEVYRMGAVCIVYVLSVQVLVSHDRFRKVVALVAVFAAGLALFSVVQHVTSDGLIYWFRELDGGHFGPFVNGNHYAGFMVLLFPLLFALFYAHKPQVRYGSFRESLVDMFTGRESNLHLLFGLAALMVGTSVFVSLSRGGVSSLCVSMLLLSFMYLAQKGGSKKGLLILTFITLIILSVSWFGWDAVMKEFSNGFTDEGKLWDARFTYWDDTIRVIRDFGCVGTGFGTFTSIFPSYQSYDVGGRLVSHAHGDYFELLSSGGYVAGILCAAFFGTLYIKTFLGYRRRRERLNRMLYLGVVVGMFGFLVHSICEFNFYNGANTLWFFFVAGLLVSAAHTRLRGSKATYLDPVKRQDVLWMGFFVVSGLFVTSVHYNMRSLIAEVAFANARGTVLTPSMDAEEAEEIFQATHRAYTLNPRNARYALALASAYAFRQEPILSRRYFARAAQLNPASAEVFHRFVLQAKGLDRSTITRCLKMARNRDVINPVRSKFLAASLFEEGNTVGAMSELKRAMALAPTKKNIRDSLGLLIYHGVPFDDIIELIPPLADACLMTADFFEDLNRQAFSEELLNQAYVIALSREKQELGVYFRLSSRFLAQNNMSQALSVLQQAAKYYPDNAAVYRKCGDIYSKMGIGFRARDEYRKALALRPNDRRLREKWEKAGGVL